MIRKIKRMFAGLKKYSFLIKQLVARDFKVKYKRSVLGVLWSLLYPVLTMSVMALVFTQMFRLSTTGVNYLVYLMSGLVIFNYFSEATNLGMSSVVANFGLINKVYIPKYIFPLSKCLFVGINFLLTLIPLYAIIFLTGTGISIHHMLLPFVVACLFLFVVGMAFLLSAISVFLRDMFYIYGVMITLWMYMTPIMYDFAMIPEKYQVIFKLNPLYWFIKFARDIILYKSVPVLSVWIYCLICAFVPLLLGITVFRKTQDKFIYYV